MKRRQGALAGAACAGLAAAAAAFASPRDAPAAADAGCPVLAAPATTGQTWTVTVDPGAHRAEVARAIAAYSAVGSQLQLRMADGGRPAQIVVAPDRELHGSRIGLTRGCLLPGAISARSSITVDRGRPAGLLRELAIAHAIGVAVGLRTDDRDRCATMASTVNRTVDGCGPEVSLVQPADGRALIAIWGQAR
jgi:hypothetical protein